MMFQKEKAAFAAPFLFLPSIFRIPSSGGFTASLFGSEVLVYQDEVL
jgi:hypothetical protein